MKQGNWHKMCIFCLQNNSFLAMFEGVLIKMRTALEASGVHYYLKFPTDFLHLNNCINQQLTLSFKGYECLSCGSTTETFRQGFCRKCFFEQPQAGDWVMRPELSQAHLGIEDRDLAFEQKVQLQPHWVYLALSSHLKVGVTRKVQIPTRWIDQGAHQAIPLLEVPNRYLAGVAEVALKEHFSDKTNWRKMLQNEAETVDFHQAYTLAIDHLPSEVTDYIVPYQEPQNIDFPVEQYPQKVKSLNLVKAQKYQGVLKGIKGQYLIFEDQKVFNIRSNEGLVVEFSVGGSSSTEIPFGSGS